LGPDQELIVDTKGVRVPVEGGFVEQNEFIQFDHGTPADPDPESESEHEGSESGSESEHEEEDEGNEDQDEDEEMSDVTETGKLSRQPSTSATHEGGGEEDDDDDDDDEDEVLGIVM
jgi:hypothetical protein